MVQATTALGTSLAFPSAVTSGNLLIVAVNNSVTPSISDSLGTSYTEVYQDLEAPTGINYTIYAGIAPSSGANTVTLNTTGDSFQNLGIMEVLGATATIDVQAAVDTGSGNPSSQTATVSVTTAVLNDFLFFGVGGAHNGNVFSFGSPFALDSQINGNDSQAIGHSSAGSAGTYTASVTISGGTGTDYDQLVLIAFEPVSAGISGSEGDLYFDTSTTPLTGYVYHSSVWSTFS